ncbi:glycoside hydrolase family 117 protein [Catenovulum sediminis]|uniref:glycoside hydrolase family 117 protein n=1 Tax=Catenovulum sediminis TaxID=1740262 RepID=UPI0011805BCF|nr:family 43 glycosylhydrolase [Catenovulum sediminis]
MQKIAKVLFSVTVLISLVSCQSNDEQSKTQPDAKLDLTQFSEADFDYLGIKDPQYLSAASKRALQRNYHQNSEWFGIFTKRKLTGDFAYEPGVIRRDPSKVLSINGLYYTWYTKTHGPGYGFDSGDPELKVFPWDKSEIWYATSSDGFHWTEQGIAVGRGKPGAFDDRSVFTPEILQHKDKFYLVYQTIKAPYLNRSYNQVGMAIADNANGPWKKLAKPILEPSETGEWLGQQDNRFLVKSQGEWDSHKVHDPTLMYFNNKFYLYYKGERKGEKTTMGGREIRWGVAIADNPQGPYIKSPYNPITHSGHELAVWHYNGGIAMISCKDGPEKETIQYAKDGINFEIMAVVDNVPDAIGLVDELADNASPTSALNWGLYHEYVIPEGKSWLQGDNYIARFSFISKNNLRKSL